LLLLYLMSQKPYYMEIGTPIEQILLEEQN
jgi:hypothetical protein